MCLSKHSTSSLASCETHSKMGRSGERLGAISSNGRYQFSEHYSMNAILHFPQSNGPMNSTQYVFRLDGLDRLFGNCNSVEDCYLWRGGLACEAGLTRPNARAIFVLCTTVPVQNGGCRYNCDMYSDLIQYEYTR